jgi:hypothetical protein
VRGYWFLAVAAALALVPLSASAAASGILTVGGTTGPAVAPGDLLMGTLVGNAVFQNASGTEKITCTMSTVRATDVTNAVPPGTAAVSVDSVTFGGCSTSGLFGATVGSITTNASSACPWNASVSDGSGSGNVTVTANTSSGCSGTIASTVVLNVGGSITCSYTARNNTLTGSAPLGSSSSINFSNQEFDGASGSSGFCFTPGFFGARYTFTDGVSPVFVN